VVWSQAYYSVLVSKTGGVGLRPVSIRRTDDNYPTFDRQTYAQSEPRHHVGRRGPQDEAVTLDNAFERCPCRDGKRADVGEWPRLDALHKRRFASIEIGRLVRFEAVERAKVSKKCPSRPLSDSDQSSIYDGAGSRIRTDDLLIANL